MAIILVRMEFMKKLYFTFCLLLISVMLVGCVGPDWQKYHPNNFPNSIWATKDNAVVIEIDDNSGDYKTGYINIENNTQELFFAFPTRPDITVSTGEQIESGSGEYLERWQAETPQKDKLTVTVVETTYFNVGDVLIFYRTDKTLDNGGCISVDKAEQKAEEAIPQKEYEQIIHFNRKETINYNVYYVFYSYALSYEQKQDNDGWSRNPVVTAWIYVDAISGEIYKVDETGIKVNWRE